MCFLLAVTWLTATYSYSINLLLDIICSFKLTCRVCFEPSKAISIVGRELAGKFTYFLVDPRQLCCLSRSLCATCFLPSDFFTWWLSSRESSGITPALVLLFFLSDKLKHNGLVLLLARAPTPRGCSLRDFYHPVPSAEDAVRTTYICWNTSNTPFFQRLRCIVCVQSQVSGWICFKKQALVLKNNITKWCLVLSSHTTTE